MSEAEIHRIATWVEIGLAVATMVGLQVMAAPYGRHRKKGWGPELPPRIGWILMEAPAVLFMGWVFSRGSSASEVVPLVLLCFWQLHYVHRTFVFPFRMRAKGRGLPVAIIAMAWAFNFLNAYVNARWISNFGAYGLEWLWDPRFLAGAGVFVVGMYVNVRADSVLFRLRKTEEGGYSIPRGWLYEHVSCPNYLGEILEWTGWALMTFSLPGLAFALYTIANLAPRAAHNHRWYRETFEDYPSRRRALIPGIW